MVRFMSNKGEKIMKGSVHEDNFYGEQCVGTQDSKDNDNMDAKK